MSPDAWEAKEPQSSKARAEKLPFWARQFQARATAEQQAFDVTFGVWLPALCLFFDPAVFTERGMLHHWALGSYVGMGAAMLAMLWWLLFRPASAVLAGFMQGAALFAFLLGTLLLPLSFMGLFIVIGVLGFSPFFTAFAFWRSGVRALKVVENAAKGIDTDCPRAGMGLSRKIAVGALLFTLPLAVQAGGRFVVDRDLRRVAAANEAEFDAIVANIRRFWFATHMGRLSRTLEQLDSDGRTKQETRLRAAWEEASGRSLGFAW